MPPRLDLAQAQTDTLTASYRVSDQGTLQLRDSTDRQFRINAEGLKGEGAAASPADVTYRISRNEFLPFDVIGEGASSCVRKAMHVPSHTFLALKSIRVTDREKRSQMLNEIKWLIDVPAGGLRGLVRFCGAFFTPEDHEITIALEYMDAGSLAGALQKAGRVPERVLAAFCRQILLALRVLHVERNTIHRDIKPGNLLLSQAGECKLSDFGLAVALQEEYMCSSYKGTTCYMSPERVQNGPYSRASDIWSLGLVLVEAPPELPEGAGFSPEFMAFCAACLQKDPGSRSGVDDLLAMPWVQPDRVAPSGECAAFTQGVVDTAAKLESVAQMFCMYYYRLFDGSKEQRAQLAGLYTDSSVLTCDSERSVGRGAIVPKLAELLKFHPALGKVTHKANHVDAQPCGSGGVLIAVTGSLLGSGPATKAAEFATFAETFLLQEDVAGSNQYVVLNQLRQLTSFK